MTRKNNKKPRITSGEIEAIVNKERIELIGFLLIEISGRSTTFYRAYFETPFKGFVFEKEYACYGNVIAYLQKALDYCGFYLSNTKYREKDMMGDLGYTFEGDLYKEKQTK